MAQTIITQNRTIINFEKLLAVFVDPDYDDNENLVGFSLVGVTDMDEKKDSILLGRYPDEESAMKANNLTAALIGCLNRTVQLVELCLILRQHYVHDGIS